MYLVKYMRTLESQLLARLRQDRKYADVMTSTITKQIGAAVHAEDGVLVKTRHIYYEIPKSSISG